MWITRPGEMSLHSDSYINIDHFEDNLFFILHVHCDYGQHHITKRHINFMSKISPKHNSTGNPQQQIYCSINSTQWVHYGCLKNTSVFEEKKKAFSNHLNPLPINHLNHLNPAGSRLTYQAFQLENVPEIPDGAKFHGVLFDPYSTFKYIK